MKMPLIRIMVISPFIFLSACSVSNTATHKTDTLSTLQRDYNQYQYSSYVMDNLKELPGTSNMVAERSSSINKSKLKAYKYQLASRKKYSAKRLINVKNDNGLHKVSPALMQQISRLTSNDKYEEWLKNHSSLDAVLALVIKNNLDIQMAQELAQASLSKYDQVDYLDDMLSQYAAFTKSISLTGSTQKHKKSVAAGFPFPGLLALKSSIIDQAVEASRLQIKQTTQDAISNTKIAYYELQYLQQEIILTQKNIKLLKTLKEELKSSYSTNSAELSGILQIDIDIANERNKHQVAKNKQRATVATLGALLNLSPNFQLGKLDKSRGELLAKNISQQIKIAQQNRVEIARLQTNLEKMRRIIQLSEKRFYPDFDAGYSRFQGDKFTTKPKIRKNNFFAKNDAYLTETRQKYKALQFQIKALQNRTADDIQQAVSNYQIQKNTHTLYENKVLPKARSSLDIAKSLYETGEVSLVDVIRAQRLLVNYQLKLMQSRKGMNINLTKVKRLIGK